MILGIRKLHGMLVVTKDSFEVGEVIGVDVDTSQWESVAIEIRLRRDQLEPLKLLVPVWGTQIVRLAVDHIAAISATDSMVHLTHSLASLKHAITHGIFNDDDWAERPLPPAED